MQHSPSPSNFVSYSTLPKRQTECSVLQLAENNPKRRYPIAKPLELVIQIPASYERKCRPRGLYLRVVKSTSLAGLKSPSAAFSQVQASAGRTPQAQVAPAGRTFSVAARWQVHSPAGRARHEQRAPVWMAFSVAALSQVQ